MKFPNPNPPARTNVPEVKFGLFRLCPDGTLFRQSTEIQLPPKELQLLRLFLGSAGRILSADELRQSLWGAVFVSHDSLPRCVSALRAHLGTQDCIQTVYKRGYRFTIPITLPSPPLRLEQARPVAYENLRVLTVSPPRLAILPLLSGPDVPPALGVEIAESTIQRLSRMRVPIALLMARDSVFAMAAEGATALQTGTALKAQLALAGSITALPTHLRIRVEMIRVADGVQLWIDDFLVPRAGISVETEAARRVAIAIRSRAAMHSGLDDAPEIDSEEMIRRRA